MFRILVATRLAVSAIPRSRAQLALNAVNGAVRLLDVPTTEIITHSPADTVRWAESFAATLKGGEVIALIGDLGAGKTVVAKGIGRGLGVRESVISPTFNYVLEYRGRLPLFHADLYRIEDAGTFRALGLEEYFDRGGVFVIEWAERVRELLPADTIFIEIEPGSTSEERSITVRQAAC